MKIKKSKLREQRAIAFFLLPALVIVGSEFWHAFLAETAADINAFNGLLLVVIGMVYRSSCECDGVVEPCHNSLCSRDMSGWCKIKKVGL